MIDHRIADKPNILLIFDSSQHLSWGTKGRVTENGIEPLLKRLMDNGVTMDEVSACCLSDVFIDKPKAADFKAKAEAVAELLETRPFNLVITVGAGAFERICGRKGAAKYFGQVIESEIYPGMKLLPCPTPSQAKYDPSVLGILDAVAKLAAGERASSVLEVKEKIPTNYSVLNTIEKCREFFRYFLSDKVPVFAYDLETTGFRHNVDEITTIQFSHKPGYSYLIPCMTVGEWSAAPYKWPAEEWEEIKGNIRLLLTHPDKLVVGHNKKFDDKFCFHHWQVPLNKTNSWDTMIAAFLCDENSPNGLKDLTCRFTDMGDYELELERFKSEYCKKHKVLKQASTKNPEKPVFSYGFIPFETLAPYALADTDATIRLYHHFVEELKKEEQVEVHKLVMRITWLLTRFEINGWGVDVPYTEQLKIDLTAEIAECEAELLKDPRVLKAAELLAEEKLVKENLKRKSQLTELKKPFVFNLGSNQQKAKLFFDVMHLPVVKRTQKGKGKGSPSTDQECVAIWVRSHPECKEFLKALQYYSMLCKFLGTYVIGILRNTVGGRVFPTFNACGAKTGRTSSRSPNQQNIPSRGDPLKMALVKKIKRIFTAPPGSLMLGADLASAEMRWAAIVSNDAKLTECFQGDGLIHEQVSQELFPYITCAPKDIKKLYEFERNSVAKVVQFMSFYGGGADALARKVNDSINERRDIAEAKGETCDLQEFTKERAQEILDNYFQRYSGLDFYIKSMSRFIAQHGYAPSVYGYRRRIPAVNSTDEGIKAQAIRQGVNATVQNPASVCLLLSLANFQEEIDERGWNILLMGSIHDSGYAEVLKEDLLEAKERLIYHLTVPPLPGCKIPIEADAEWGQDWSHFSDDFGSAFSDEIDDEEEDDEEFSEVEEAA